MLLPIAFGAACFGGLYLLDRSREDNYGAVGLTMGGRGRGAGQGVASWLGGRSFDGPYEYSSPSSVVTNWSTFDVFGAEESLQETMGFIDDFFRLNFTREGRAERLQSKVDAAQERMEALSSEAKSAGEDAEELEKIAAQMARLEQNIDKWNAKLQRVQSDSFGSASRVEEHLLVQAIELADMMASSGRALSVASDEASKRAAVVRFISAYDALCALIPPAMRSRISDSAKNTLSAKMGAAQSVYGALEKVCGDTSQIRESIVDAEDVEDAVAMLEEDAELGLI